MTEYLKHRRSLDSKKETKTTTVTSAVGRLEAGSVVATISTALTEMQRNMAAFMHEIRNQLASFNNPSFSAPSLVSIHEGFPGGCMAPPSSSVVPSLARPRIIPPFPIQ